MSAFKLSAAHKRILSSLERKPRIASQVEGSGSTRQAYDLLREGYARLEDDAAVKDPPGSNIPALSYAITDKGRKVLEAGQ